MSKKVIYLSYQPYTLSCAKKLQQDLGWTPVYWKTDQQIDNRVKDMFPGIVTHNYQDAIRGKLPQNIDLSLEAIDSELLDDMVYHESVVLNMMNRNALSVPFTYQERIRLYHRHLRFYSALLKKLQPDYIIFEDTPHQACDYILYILAQKEGIRTILCETSMFLNYFVPMERFEEGNQYLIRSYRQKLNSNDTYELSEEFSREISRIRGDYKAGAHAYMQDHLKRFKNQNSTFSLFKNYFNKYLSYFSPSLFVKRIQSVNALFNTSPVNIYNHEGRTIEDAALSNWKHMQELRKLKKLKKQNLAYYKSVQTNAPDYKVPFIYCPLHFQPEKSTSPWGGHFTNQYLMIDMLSKNIPSGWKIYVKDHIAQYIYPQTGEPVRNKSFFDDIVGLPNVEIVPIETSSFDLIDKSVAVASVAGTVLWESVVRNKPSLAFGIGHNCWCGGCEGVFYTPDNASLKQALELIKQGITIDHEKIKLYAKHIELFGTRGYVGGQSQAALSGITPEENGYNHARAIASFIHRTDSVRL